MRARGYKPFGTNLEQDALLDRIIAEVGPGRWGSLIWTAACSIPAFDWLPSFTDCFFKGGDGRYFAFAERSDFTDWDLKKPLRKYGMPNLKSTPYSKSLLRFGV